MPITELDSSGRDALIATLDDHVVPHRAPLSQQLMKTPVLAFRRIATVRAGHLATLVGLNLSLTTRTFFGTALRFPYPACWDLGVYRTYIDEAELRLLKYIMRNLRTGATMIDVGANIGFMCQLASTVVGPDGRVFAFEPSATALAYLRGNVADFDNVEIVPVAAMDRVGTVTFFEGSGAAMVSSSTVESHALDRTPSKIREITVPTTTLDTFCADRSLSPDMLKIDVEGAEISVLKGAEKLLDATRPGIVMEVSLRDDEYEQQYAPSVALLAQHGYVPHVLNADGTASAITPPQIPQRARDCTLENGYLHQLDNVLFIHPERPQA